MKNLRSSLVKLLTPSKRTILLIATVAAVTLVLSTIVFFFLSRFANISIPSLGNIRTIGVEVSGADIVLADQEEHIDWGTVYPGTFTNRSFYVQSISNVDAKLRLEATEWIFRNSTDQIVAGPSDFSQFANLTWNYDNKTVSPREVLYVTLTLSMNNSLEFIEFLIDNKVTSFSFDITIRAIEE